MFTILGTGCLNMFASTSSLLTESHGENKTIKLYSFTHTFYKIYLKNAELLLATG